MDGWDVRNWNLSDPAAMRSHRLKDSNEKSVADNTASLVMMISDQVIISFIKVTVSYANTLKPAWLLEKSFRNTVWLRTGESEAFWSRLYSFFKKGFMPSYSLCALTAQCVHSTPNTLSPSRRIDDCFAQFWGCATDLDLTHTPGPQKLVREGISVPAIACLCFVFFKCLCLRSNSFSTWQKH